MSVEKVASDLEKHEAICAERWHTAFNRFDDIDEEVNKIQNILIASAVGIITAGAVAVWTIITIG